MKSIILGILLVGTSVQAGEIRYICAGDKVHRYEILSTGVADWGLVSPDKDAPCKEAPALSTMTLVEREVTHYYVAKGDQLIEVSPLPSVANSLYMPPTKLDPYTIYFSTGLVPNYTRAPIQITGCMANNLEYTYRVIEDGRIVRYVPEKCTYTAFKGFTQQPVQTFVILDKGVYHAIVLDMTNGDFIDICAEEPAYCKKEAFAMEVSE